MRSFDEWIPGGACPTSWVGASGISPSAPGRKGAKRYSSKLLELQLALQPFGKLTAALFIKFLALSTVGQGRPLRLGTVNLVRP